MSDYTLADIPPDHQCTEDEECAYPAGLLIAATLSSEDGGSGHRLQMRAHRIEMKQMIAILVSAIDDAAVSNTPDGVPVALAWTRGRDMVKTCAEKLEPPAEVNFDVAQLMRSLMGGDDDDE